MTRNRGVYVCGLRVKPSLYKDLFRKLQGWGGYSRGQAYDVLHKWRRHERRQAMSEITRAQQACIMAGGEWAGPIPLPKEGQP